MSNRCCLESTGAISVFTRKSRNIRMPAVPNRIDSDRTRNTAQRPITGVRMRNVDAQGITSPAVHVQRLDLYDSVIINPTGNTLAVS